MKDPCPVCRGTGFEVRVRPDGMSTAVPCDCGLKDRGLRLLHLARIPRRYDHCTLDNFDPRGPSLAQALQIAREWVERWPDRVEQGILFHGGPGTGKTHLAVGIARELIQVKGARVLFQEQRELLKEIQATFDAGSDRSEAEVLGRAAEAEVLILDDIGVGRTTPWAREILHDLITQRYNEKLPLIMTSNRPTGEESEVKSGDASTSEGLTLRDRLGEALMSRLYEMCLMVPVHGGDFRREILHARNRF